MCDFHRNQIGRIERAEQTVSFDGLLQLSHGLAVPPSEIFKLIPVQTAPFQKEEAGGRIRPSTQRVWRVYFRA